MTTQTDDMKPRQVQDLPTLVAAADDVQFEIHGTIGEWYLRIFELKDDELGRSTLVGSYVLTDEAGQPRPYAQLEALILEMNRATGTNDYDFDVYQYPDHGHSPGDAAPVVAERAPASPMKEIFDKVDAAFAMTIDDDRSTVSISRADWAKIKAAVQEAEELRSAAEPFAIAWGLRAQRPAQTSGNKVREQRDLEAGFYSVMKPDGERFLLTGHDLKRLGEAFDKKTSGAIGEQWWLAELDQHGNPTLIDGAHGDRAGADQAKHLFDRLGFSKDRRLAVARVTLSEPRPSSEGVNEEALGALNSIGLRPQAADECDHDWDDMGDGTMACTYPDCNATRPKRPDDDEEA